MKLPFRRDAIKLPFEHANLRARWGLAGAVLDSGYAHIQARLQTLLDSGSFEHLYELHICLKKYGRFGS